MLGQLLAAVQLGWASRISSSMDAARTSGPDPGVSRRGGGSVLGHWSWSPRAMWPVTGEVVAAGAEGTRAGVPLRPLCAPVPAPGA